MSGVDFEKFLVIVKTLRNYEDVVAQILKETFPEIKVLSKPLNFSSLILVGDDVPTEDLARKIKLKTPEVERALPVKCYTSADIDAIADAAKKIANNLADAKSFAVNTVRRGRHNFTSIEVNVRVDAVIKGDIGLPVNLDYPDKIVFVEIIGPHAYLGIIDGSEFLKKIRSGKFQVRNILRKFRWFRCPILTA
ncbi:MAG: THUMP domain-containing protein [Candidatus Bathyarchaeia archaeon]